MVMMTMMMMMKIMMHIAYGDADNDDETLSLNLLLFAEAAEIVKDICVAVKFLHDMNIAHR